MSLVLLIVVIMLLVGSLPRWGYHSYGYAVESAARLCRDRRELRTSPLVRSAAHRYRQMREPGVLVQLAGKLATQSSSPGR